MNNEKQIAQKLEATINTPEPTQVENIETTTEPQPIEAFSNNLPLDNMVAKYQVMELLNIPHTQMQSAETVDHIEYLMRWALENSPSNDISDILETISRQSRTMGIQFSQDRLERLYRYAKLSNQRKALEIQMRSLNG